MFFWGLIILNFTCVGNLLDYCPCENRRLRIKIRIKASGSLKNLKKQWFGGLGGITFWSNFSAKHGIFCTNFSAKTRARFNFAFSPLHFPEVSRGFPLDFSPFSRHEEHKTKQNIKHRTDNSSRTRTSGVVVLVMERSGFIVYY